MQANATPLQAICEQCGKAFRTYPSRVKNGRARFCSRECASAWKRTLIGAKAPQYKGKRQLTNGYFQITHPETGDRIQEHRYVMECHLGRPLRSDEHVHHEDGNKRNNAIDNLVLTNIVDHARKHAKANPQNQKIATWALHHLRCVRCGTTEIRHQAHGLCRRCYLREYQTARD